MSSYERALWLEEVFGPPETREPGPSDENQRNVMLPTRDTVVPTRTFEDRAQAFIAEGLCPVCKVTADDGVCSICGWQLTKDRSTVEPPAVVELPAQPELTEEYGPAAVDAA